MYCLNSIKSIPTFFSGCQTHFGQWHFKLSVFYLTHAFNTKCALPLVISFYFYLFKAKICFFPRFQFFFVLIRWIFGCYGSYIYLFFLNIIFFCVVCFLKNWQWISIFCYIFFFTSLFCIKSIYSVVYISQSFHLCLFLKMQNLREITFNTMQSIRFKN